jgi:ParB family transcriptional regulator, chromosome partitioning protein
MTTRHKGLGRGLDALLGGADRKPRDDEETLQQIAVASLKPGKYQPRTRMDEASLAQLADSIRARGMIQPIVVRAVGAGQYEILAGERRWRAARLAGLERVPAVVRDVPDEAAQAIGRSRAGVTNLLRLLELAASVQAMVQEGRIDMGHARALLALGKSKQVELAERIAQQGLSVRETERLVQAASSSAPRPARAAGQRLDADSRRLQEELAESLGASVKLKPRRGGKGSVIIDYSSLDELQGIVGKLRRA